MARWKSAYRPTLSTSARTNNQKRMIRLQSTSERPGAGEENADDFVFVRTWRPSRSQQHRHARSAAVLSARKLGPRAAAFTCKSRASIRLGTRFRLERRPRISGADEADLPSSRGSPTAAFPRRIYCPWLIDVLLAGGPGPHGPRIVRPATTRSGARRLFRATPKCCVIQRAPPGAADTIPNAVVVDAFDTWSNGRLSRE